jgi:hypothetical protein
MYWQGEKKKSPWKFGYASKLVEGNMVLVEPASPAVFAHEWIHTCGFLVHRPKAKEAIMFSPLESYANEINRYECDELPRP